MGRLFDAYLRQYPITQEFAASLAEKAAFLLTTLDDGVEEGGPLAGTDSALLDQQVHQVVDNDKGQVAGLAAAGDGQGHQVTPKLVVDNTKD